MRLSKDPSVQELAAQFKLLDSASTARVDAVAAEDAAMTAEKAAAAAQAAAEAIPKPPVPDPRAAPHFELLYGSDDARMMARISPRRNRWPGLQEIDRRIEEIDQQQAAMAAELQQTRELRQGAEARDRVAVADWLAARRVGPRPVSEPAELDERIAALQVEHDAHDIARARELEERVAYVRKQRKALVRDAERATEERRSRYLELVAELEQAREELIACRSSELWARLFPSESLATEPPYMNALVGARLSVQQKHLPGVSAQLPAPSIFALLRADGQHLSSIATVEQAAAIQGVSTSKMSSREAAWQDRASEHELQRREKEHARRRFRQEWGYDPPEFGL